MKLRAESIAASGANMLEANKSKWFEKLFSVYNRNLLKRRFNSLQVFNLQESSLRNPTIPLIIYANHSSWWDGLVAHHLSQKMQQDFFVMMEEKQLKNLKLFLKLGAFSVVREKPREALQSINYSVELLKEKPNRTLWIFPQGEILPNDARPFIFYNGLSKIIEKVGECAVLPIVFRYEFLGNYKPDIFASIGNLNLFDSAKVKNSKELTKYLSDVSQNLLDELKSKIINSETDDFQNII